MRLTEAVQLVGVLSKDSFQLVVAAPACVREPVVPAASGFWRRLLAVRQT